MEVRCSNCETEYEFDDALVSARGTSVKCTQCGHQFRVTRDGPGSTSAETWAVRLAKDGQEIKYSSLRDLQQGIVQGKLSPDDSLTHGGQPARPLKDIYELQTFFATARTRAAHPVSKRTLLGGAGGALSRSSLPPPRKRAEPVTPVGGLSPAEEPEENSSLEAEASARLTSSVPAAPLASNSLPTPSAVARVSVPPAPRMPEFGGEIGATLDTSGAQRSNPPQHQSNRAVASGSSAPPAGNSDVPWQNMQGLHAAESEIPPLAGRSSSARSRWIAALVVLGGFGLVGGTVGKDYIARFVQAPAPTPQVDSRVPNLLRQAKTALSQGDFEAARTAVAKAELLAEREPSVAAALAGLELSRAESNWLELRLVRDAQAFEPPKPKRWRSAKVKAAEAAAAQLLAKTLADTKLEASEKLKSRLAKAREALAKLEAAPEVGANGNAVAADPSKKAVTPEPLELRRVRVDLLRLEGKTVKARQAVSRLSAKASDPDNAYTLGALDFAEGEVGLPAAVGRLRLAARSEAGLGKARSLLVYALARQGDREAAEGELGKLRLMAEHHPLIPALTTRVSRVPEKAPKAKTSKKAAPVAAKSAPRGSGSGVSRSTSAASSAKVPNDDRAAIKRAESMHRGGDLSGAEKLYGAVLARSPQNVDALSGMGDVFRQRGRTAQAMAYYNRVLAKNPTHLRTVMASADMNWHAQRQQAAVNLYRRALGQVGTSDPMGARALRRIEEFETRRPAPKAPAAPAPKAESESLLVPAEAAKDNVSEPADTSPSSPEANAAPSQPAPPAVPRKTQKRVPKKPAKPPHPFAIPPSVTPPPSTRSTSTSAPNLSTGVK